MSEVGDLKRQQGLLKKTLLLVFILVAAIVFSWLIIFAAANKASYFQRNTETNLALRGSTDGAIETIDASSLKTFQEFTGTTSTLMNADASDVTDNPTDSVNETEEAVYTVRFHDLGGDIVKMHETTGGFVEPPGGFKINGNRVFLGWDKDILNVRGNTDFYPITTDINDMTNVIYLDAAYVSTGQRIKTDLNLGGKVRYSDIQFEIAYNPVDLKYVGIENVGANTIIQHDEQNAKLRITVSADDNILAEEILATLVFSVITDGFVYSEFKIKLDSIEMLLGGEKIGTECTMFNGKVYIY